MECRIFIRIIRRNYNTLHLWHRNFCRNSSLQAVCDTPIARITGCVSLLRILVGDSPFNYSGAIRVNRVMLVSLCAETIKTRFCGGQNVTAVWKEMHPFIKWILCKITGEGRAVFFWTWGLNLDFHQKARGWRGGGRRGEGGSGQAGNLCMEAINPLRG